MPKYDIKISLTTSQYGVRTPQLVANPHNYELGRYTQAFVLRCAAAIEEATAAANRQWVVVIGYGYLYLELAQDTDEE